MQRDTMRYGLIILSMTVATGLVATTEDSHPHLKESSSGRREEDFFSDRAMEQKIVTKGTLNIEEQTQNPESDNKEQQKQTQHVDHTLQTLKDNKSNDTYSQLTRKDIERRAGPHQYELEKLNLGQGSNANDLGVLKESLEVAKKNGDVEVALAINRKIEKETAKRSGFTGRLSKKDEWGVILNVALVGLVAWCGYYRGYNAGAQKSTSEGTKSGVTLDQIMRALQEIQKK